MHGLVSYNRLAVKDIPNRSNGVGLLLGGGMDIPFNKVFAIRLFQVDYVWAAPSLSRFRRARVSEPTASRDGGCETADRCRFQLRRS